MKRHVRCIYCKKPIKNNRACFFYRKDYDMPKKFGESKIAALCSVKCSLHFHGIPCTREG